MILDGISIAPPSSGKISSMIKILIMSRKLLSKIVLAASVSAVTGGVVIGDCAIPTTKNTYANSARKLSSKNIPNSSVENDRSLLHRDSKSFAIASNSTSTPVIFNSSISGKAGDLIYLQGARFGSNPQVVLNQKVQLKIVSKGNNYITAQIPSDVSTGAYGIQVLNGTTYSKTVYLNQAQGMSFDTPEIASEGRFRIFGRNLLLTGATPTVRLVNPATGDSLKATVMITGSDAYVLKVKAPSNVIPGVRYDVYVSNGYGGTAGETKADETLIGRKGGTDYWDLGVAWAADYNFYNNVYNVKTDSRLAVRAVGDGSKDDLPAIQQAIDRAAKDGGGVVYLPAGTYRLASPDRGLHLASRVVLAGESRDKTTITYGHGQPYGHSGIWWPNGTTVSGIVDLTYRNVNEGGRWKANLNAGSNSSALFIQRARLELSSGGGIYWNRIPKTVLANTIINQSYDPQNSNGGPWRFDGSKYFVIRKNELTACAQYGFNFAENGVIESNRITRNAKVYVPGRNLVANFAKNLAIINNTFDLINGPDKTDNDGETILSEGGGDKRFNDVGVITGASANTIQDSSKNWSASQLNSATKHPVVVIVSGEGAGQWREIVSNTSTSLTIDRPWDVIPTAGSRYSVIAWSAANWLVKGNTFQDHARGVMFYSASSLNLAIVGNNLLNNGAIWLRGEQNFMDSKMLRFDVNYNIQVIGNTLKNTRVTTDKSHQAAFIGVQPAMAKPSSTFGTLTLGIQIKDNSIEGIKNTLDWDHYQDGYYNNTYIFQPPKQLSEDGIPSLLGTIFQNNSCKNCTSVFNLNGGASQTVIWNSGLNGSDSLIRDTSLAGTNHSSVNTVVGP